MKRVRGLQQRSRLDPPSWSAAWQAFALTFVQFEDGDGDRRTVGKPTFSCVAARRMACSSRPVAGSDFADTIRTPDCSRHVPAAVGIPVAFARDWDVAGTLCVFRREVHTIMYVGAQVAMEGIAIALKKSLREKRPAGRQRDVASRRLHVATPAAITRTPRGMRRLRPGGPRNAVEPRHVHVLF